jgi:hypothetical protein
MVIQIVCLRMERGLKVGYLHIENLYRNQTILDFKECYALEKIHGTSAHVAWKNGTLTFYSGGEKHDPFVALFSQESLVAAFEAMGHADVTVFGEAYGGKCQGMSKTYGDKLRFVAFDVQIGEAWLDVPNAEDVCKKLGIEYVHYVRIPCDLAAIDLERDAPSIQAARNGMTRLDDPATWKIREGIVLRPIHECTDHRGNRVIAKHKRAEFSERKTIPNIDPAKREIADKAEAIADEWVTDMRMNHVLDKLGNPSDMADTGKVIAAMVEDVCREASGEIVDSKAVRKAIGSAAAKIYRKRVMQITQEAK